MACASGPLSAIDADLLIVPLFQGEGAAAVPDLDAATGGELARALAAKEFAAKPYELAVAPVADSKWRTRRVMMIGGGAARARHRSAAPDGDRRRAGGASALGRPRRVRGARQRARPPISHRPSPKG